MAMKQMRLTVPRTNPPGYVLYVYEHLRDGREEWSKCFADLDAALRFVNEIAGGPGGSCHSFRLFTLGKEVPLVCETVEESQPPKTTSRYVVAAPGEGRRP